VRTGVVWRLELYEDCVRTGVRGLELCGDWSYMRTGVVWVLKLYEDWGCVGMELYEDWGCVGTGVIRGLCANWS
jgi:hypothetical protein